MQYVLFLAGLVAAMVLGNWYRLYLSRPKLTTTGGGSGGAQGYKTASITISHRPGLFGIRLDESMLFGKQLHRRIEVGLNVERNTANDCDPVLMNPAGTEIVAPLYWRVVTDGVETFPHLINIACRQEAQLMVFARLNDEPLKYFPFAPDNSTPPTLRSPAENQRMSGKHEFLLRVRYDGRRKLDLPVTMHERANGQLEYRTPRTGGSF